MEFHVKKMSNLAIVITSGGKNHYINYWYSMRNIIRNVFNGQKEKADVLYYQSVLDKLQDFSISRIKVLNWEKI